VCRRITSFYDGGGASLTISILVFLHAGIYVLPAFARRLTDLLEPTKQYDCFLSHAWDVDSAGRSNHERVLRVHTALSAAGVKTWVDTENLDADLNNEMSNGIDRSTLVLVFITKAYIDKVQGYGRRGLDENCKAEFEYALRRHGTQRMLAVVMDPACLDTATWTGAVGFRLGSQIYHNLSDEPTDAERLKSLVEAIQGRIHTLTGKASLRRESTCLGGHGSHIPLRLRRASREARSIEGVE